MQIITVIASQLSAEALSTALPADGVISVTVAETRAFTRVATSVQSYRRVKVPNHFTPVFRIEVAVEDDAVARVTEGIAFARGAGLLGDARAWVSAQAEDLFASAATVLSLSA